MVGGKGSLDNQQTQVFQVPQLDSWLIITDVLGLYWLYVSWDRGRAIQGGLYSGTCSRSCSCSSLGEVE